MVTMRVVRHDRHEQVLAECQTVVIPARGEVVQLDTIDRSGEMTRPSTLWRVVSVTLHVPSIASSHPDDGSPPGGAAGRGGRAARHRADFRVRGGRRGDNSVRVQAVNDVPNPSGMSQSEPSMYSVTLEVPAHLRDWQLPAGWSWGADGLNTEHRHYQEVIDALGRSLSLVSAPDPAHNDWLESEARQLAHRNHPAMPTTYHYWASFSDSRRGPGYLRRWIAGETVGARLRRMGTDDVPGVLRVMREIGSALSYLHDLGTAHGAMSPDTVWHTPMGRLWVIGWQWAMPSRKFPPASFPTLD